MYSASKTLPSFEAIDRQGTDSDGTEGRPSNVYLSHDVYYLGFSRTHGTAARRWLVMRSKASAPLSGDAEEMTGDPRVLGTIESRKLRHSVRHPVRGALVALFPQC